MDDEVKQDSSKAILLRNRGQVTIFIIIAILIVAGIIGAILFMGNKKVERPAEVNPKQVIQKCVRDVVEKSVEKMLDNGGQRSPDRSIMYEGDEYNYLCYQADYYLSCYNLHPMLEYLVESEIRKDTLEGVQNCFNKMREDFEAKGFEVSGGPASYSIDLLPGQVKINLHKKINLAHGDSSQSFENFNTRILSPIYELIGIARGIINSESQYCNFEYNGYMLLHPDYNIRRIDYREAKIYKVTDRRTGAEFRFAVRSCALAPGI